VKIDLFSVPIWIGNIDSSKIKLLKQELKPTFGSEVNTTYNDSFGSKIEESSVKYLLENLISILDETISSRYQIKLINIWENSYGQGDFQEKHIHAGSDLSFVIYKKVEESNTVFVNPSYKLIDAFYHDCKIKQNLFGSFSFSPKCRENQVVIFPSFIEHYVKKINNATTIAGNLKLTF